jgi:hypothetical protein
MNSFKAETKELRFTVFYERSLDEKNFNYSGGVDAVSKINSEGNNELTLFTLNFSRYKFSSNNLNKIDIR